MSTAIPAPLDGGLPPSLSLGLASLPAGDVDGTGGAVASNPAGRLLNRVEYRRLTRSDVCSKLVR